MKIITTWKRHFSREQLSLKHNTPEVFICSQWQKDNSPNFWYLLYRWMVTLFFFITFVMSIVEVEYAEDDVYYREKWMIYLTNWGFTTCTLQSILCAVMLTWSFVATRKKAGLLDNKALKLYKVYWATNVIATDIAFGITILYWAIIYDASKIEVDAINVLVHGTNSVLMLVDLFVLSHPIQLGHFYLPISFGLFYVIFTAIYYAAGGTAKHGKTAIYPILDWDKPGPTVLVCLGVMVFLVILHLFAYGIYKLRKKLHEKFMCKKAPENDKSVMAQHENTAFEGDSAMVV